jgi:hypothetical protein
MAQLNNFMTVEPRPTGQRRYYATPRVVIFNDEDPLTLETKINDWIDGLATPVDPDNLYTIVQTDLSSAQFANNVVMHTALVRFHHWQPI